jgi:hypothetical protein
MKLSDAIASALASQEKQAELAKRVQELETQLKDSEDWKSHCNAMSLLNFRPKLLPTN